MKYLFLWLLLWQISDASTMTLKKILKASNQHNALSKALEKEQLARYEQTKSDTASNALSLYTEGAKTYPIQSTSGFEYLVGASKTIRIGSIQKEEEDIGMLNNQAYVLEQEHALLNFNNQLKNLYHQHCLDLENYRGFDKSYQEFVKLYRKKEKAYRYQEISKTELMQLEIEKNRLYAQVQKMKLQQEISKKHLLSLGKIPISDTIRFSCRDVYPIRSSIHIDNAFTLTKRAYKKRIESTQKALQRYAHPIDSVDLSVQYGKELDRTKYAIGISVPLNFTSSKSEHARAAALYRGSALSYRYEQTMLEKHSLFTQLKAELRSDALMVKTLRRNYANYMQKLLPMIRKSYDLGETSVIEYLLSKQKSYQLSKEIYTTKKAYYNTLFTLYTLSEQKEK